MQKNVKTGEESVLFDSIAALGNMTTPTFRNEKVGECESGYLNTYLLARHIEPAL